MPDNINEKSINETLSVIRKALKEDNVIENKKDVLILNQLIKEDGTRELIQTNLLNKEQVEKILNDKLSIIFEKHFEKWLNKNLPDYLNKFFSNKKNH